MKGNMALKKGNMPLIKGNMALARGNMVLRHVRKSYSRRQIKNDQPGSHDFRRFLRHFWTDFLEILQRPFLLKS